MKLFEIIQRVAHELEKQKCAYCLIGGHAASLYRSHERITKDVDFALQAKPMSASRTVAEKVIRTIGLKPVIGFIPRGKRETSRKSVCMVTSAPSPGEMKGIIDILLPELPWITSAVGRAQYNKIDLGFACIPVITPEDLIVAKCYAVPNSPDRFQDLDDLQQIFGSVKDLDLDYLRETLDLLNLPIPTPIEKYSPLRKHPKKTT